MELKRASVAQNIQLFIMVIESSVVQFWSKIILMITNRTCAALSFDFEITHHSLSSITIINN